jgi:PKD repeat protein
MKKYLNLTCLAVVVIFAFAGCAVLPTAAFSADPTSGPPPLTVQFTDESEGEPTSWSWDFGEGNTSTEQNPSHTYNNGGTYDVRLVVSNDKGSDTLIEPGYIIVGEEYEQVEVGGMRLRWKVKGEDLDCILSGPTTGWIAVGFDPTIGMESANIIIGYVYEGEYVEIRDDYGTAPSGHTADVAMGGTDDVSNVTGSETAGTTEISFTIPLNSGDTFDKELIPGNTYTIMLAYGSADDLDSYHSERFTTEIKL